MTNKRKVIRVHFSGEEFPVNGTAVNGLQRATISVLDQLFKGKVRSVYLDSSEAQLLPPKWPLAFQPMTANQ
jgi:hypothetical protein